MGPKGHPKEVPWDQKVIPPKTTLYLLLDPPMVREVFPKKAKNRKSGGAGFRQPLQGRNMVSRGLYDLLRHHKKVK